MSKYTILITGATSGIGFEMAKQFAEAGHEVIALGRNVDRLKDVSDLSPNIFSRKFDVGEIPKIDSFISSLFEEFPQIDILVNNAGIQYNVRVDADDYTNAQIEGEISINLTAPICLSRAALPYLEKHPSGRIVNITSGLAYVPKTTSAVYSATKSGLHLFTEGLRVQSGNEIGVTEVILPIVATPMTEGRGSGKISATTAANQIITGILKGQSKIYVGKTKALPFLLRWLPGVARRIIQKG